MASTNLPSVPDENPYASYTLDHHGLVAGMVDELGLVEKMDAMIPQELEQRNVCVGMAVKADDPDRPWLCAAGLVPHTGFFQGQAS